MTERAYTVGDLIALRRAVCGLITVSISGPYRESDRILQVEAMVQTHMLAGHTAEDLLKHRAQCESNRSPTP